MIGTNLGPYEVAAKLGGGGMGKTGDSGSRARPDRMMEAMATAPVRASAKSQLEEWRAEFEAARKRPLEQRLRYAFIRTYKPVLDDARFRSFDSLAEYREWCERALPSWLGYGRV
jgi:hypothetical protein